MGADLIKRFTWPGFISELLFGILFESAMMAIILMLAPSALLLLIFLLTAGLLLFWLLRLVAGKIWHLLLPGVLLTAGPLLLEGLPVWPRVIFAVAMLILAFRAISKRLRPDPSNTEVPPFANTFAALGWLLLINLVASWQNLTGLEMATFYLGIVYLLLSIFRRHQLALNTRLMRFVTQQSQPTGRIKRFNHILLLAFAGLLALILLVSPALHLEEVIPWLASILLLGFKKLILWLQSLTGPGDGNGPPTDPIPDPTEPGGLPPVPGEPAVWLVVLQQIFYYLLLIASAGLLLAILVAAIYSIYRKFYENRSSGPDVFEVLLPRFADDIRQGIRHRQSYWARQFGRSPEQKIRRYYYRLVGGLIRRGINLLPGTTPRDIIELTGTGDRSTLAELSQIYEKARYGPDLCTGDDVRRMLELCRQYRLKQEKSIHD